MPDRRQPKTLESLTLRKICQHLDGMCRRLQIMSQKTSSTQMLLYTKQVLRPYYINTLPASIRTQVIEETSRMLYGPSLDGSSLISGPAHLYLLTLLLSHDIKVLKVNLCCYYGCSHQALLFKLLASEGIGLESLELARSALLRLDCKLFKSTLLNIKNLLNLTLRNIANDAVLQVIGKACPQLITLDVACSKQVTDAGLKQLLLEVELKDKANVTIEEPPNSWSKLKTLMTRLKRPHTRSRKKDVENVILEYYENRNPICDTLKVLNIANTAVTSSGVLCALIYITHLESLAEYNHIGRVVELMNKGFIEFEAPLSLKQARSSKTTIPRLELLAQICPKIETLYIFEPHHPAAALSLFPCITSLSIHSIPVEPEWLNGLYGYLQTNGSNLKELNLHVVQTDNILKIDLREIFCCCPNLRKLMKDGSLVTWSVGPDPPPLKYLKKVRLGHIVTALAITKTLSLAPQLTTLHIHSCSDLTNEHLDKLLTTPENTQFHKEINNRENSLVQNLSCFYIYETSNVSATTVLDMFYNCKRLRRIGNLSNWGLDCAGISMLRNTLAHANLDVDLCPGSHWFWNNCID